MQLKADGCLQLRLSEPWRVEASAGMSVITLFSSSSFLILLANSFPVGVPALLAV
jgi:hypothetical protein